MKIQYDEIRALISREDCNCREAQETIVRYIARSGDASRAAKRIARGRDEDALLDIVLFLRHIAMQIEKIYREDDTTLSDDFDATQSTLASGFHGTIVRRTDFWITS